MIEIKGKYTTAKIMIDDVDQKCLGQIYNLVNHPVFTNLIVTMPDVHYGNGAVIGFTMPMTEYIIPNIIGSDIGCGMLAFDIGNVLPMSFEELDKFIRMRVPFGHETNDQSVIHMKDQFPWRDVNGYAQKFAVAHQNKFGPGIDLPRYTNEWFIKKCEDIGVGARRMIDSIGSLGGGNHFIEVGIDTQGNYWITIHTGSRNFGKRICDYWQNTSKRRLHKTNKEEFNKALSILKAEHTGNNYELKKKIDDLKEEFEMKLPKVNANTNGLEWLEGKEAHGYLFDMIFAQVYAKVNREYIKKAILDILKLPALNTIETIHNFIDFDDFIIRKGAIRSYLAEPMIIPFNMRDGILICEGKSNPDWNYSAPHGAGRIMSRTDAKRLLNLETFNQQMTGIYSTSVGIGTLDEAPNAYKDAKVIENAIEPTAIILNRIKPVHNMKASNSVDE